MTTATLEHPAIAEIQQQADAAITAKLAEIERLEQAAADAAKSDATKRNEAIAAARAESSRQTAAYKRKRQQLRDSAAVLASAAHEWQTAINDAHSVLASADAEQRAHLRRLTEMKRMCEQLRSDYPLADVEPNAKTLDPLRGFNLDLDMTHDARDAYKITHIKKFVMSALQNILARDV